MYKIKEKNFELSRITLKQYKLIHSLLKSQNISIPSEISEDVILLLSDFISKLLEQDILEKFLSYILVEQNKEWNEKDAKENEKLFAEVDDETLLKIIYDFFVMKVNLIQNFINSLMNLSQKRE